MLQWERKTQYLKSRLVVPTDYSLCFFYHNPNWTKISSFAYRHLYVTSEFLPYSAWVNGTNFLLAHCLFAAHMDFWQPVLDDLLIWPSFLLMLAGPWTFTSLSFSWSFTMTTLWIVCCSHLNFCILMSLRTEVYKR